MPKGANYTLVTDASTFDLSSNVPSKMPSVARFDFDKDFLQTDPCADKTTREFERMAVYWVDVDQQCLKVECERCIMISMHTDPLPAPLPSNIDFIPLSNFDRGISQSSSSKETNLGSSRPLFVMPSVASALLSGAASSPLARPPSSVASALLGGAAYSPLARPPSLACGGQSSCQPPSNLFVEFVFKHG